MTEEIKKNNKQQINDQQLRSKTVTFSGVKLSMGSFVLFLLHASYVAYLLHLKTSLYLTHENSCYAFTSLAVWKLE